MEERGGGRGREDGGGGRGREEGGGGGGGTGLLGLPLGSAVLRALPTTSTNVYTATCGGDGDIWLRGRVPKEPGLR